MKVTNKKCVFIPNFQDNRLVILKKGPQLTLISTDNEQLQPFISHNNSMYIEMSRSP